MTFNIDDNTLLEKAKNYEELFSRHEYEGDIMGEEGYEYLPGSVPILLSAPHAVNHFRSGNIKISDLYTGSIIRLLQEFTDCHIVYKIKNDETDPNYDSIENDNGYKSKVIDIVNNHNIRLFIDFHGAAVERDFNIDIGTNQGQTLNGHAYIPQIVSIIYGKYGVDNVTINKKFTAKGINNITNCIGNRTGIPSMQFEIHRNLRDFTTNFDAFKRFIIATGEIIRFFSDFDFNKNTYVFRTQKSRIHLPMDKVVFSKKDIEIHGFQKHDTFELQRLKNKANSVLVRYKESYENQELIEDSIYLTNKIYNELFGENGTNYIGEYILLRKNIKHTLNIGIPKVGIEDIYFGADLLKGVSKDKKYQLYNRVDDINYNLNKLKAYEYSNSANKIYINYYQRQLLNINLPKKVLTKENFTILLDKLSEDTNGKNLLREAYVENDNYFRINENYIERYDLIQLSKKLDLDKVELIEISKNINKVQEKNIFLRVFNKLATLLIRKKKLYLRVGRPHLTDENSAIVRIMPDTMKILGVNELDKVIIKNEDYEVSLRALEFNSAELLGMTNKLAYDEIDASIIIGIPAKYRDSLGFHSVNGVVVVYRDVDYLFKKHYNQQVLPTLAVIFTIVQTFDGTLERILLSLLFIPLAIYIGLSEERSKID